MTAKKTLIALTLIIATLAGSRGAPAQILGRIEGNFVEWTQKTIDGNHPAGSEGYVDLDGTDAEDFRTAVQAFLAENWATADSLADTVGYEVVVFLDKPNNIVADSQIYYGLIPQADNGEGRGFYFVRPRAGVLRRLVIQAPHAVEDERTGVLGSEIFRASGARALMLTGADRCASDILSYCTGSTDCGDHTVADGAHSVNTFFHIFHEEAGGEHADTRVLQLHGFFADEGEPEFSVSDGRTADNASDSYLPNAFYKDLHDRMLAVNPGLTRDGASCNKAGHGDFQCGTESVQSREFNGSPNACDDNATSANGRFIHLEMSNDLREPGDLYSQQLVIDSVNAVFPKKATAGDKIWADSTPNGTLDYWEKAVHGVTVDILNLSGAVVGSTTTKLGLYRIGNLEPGTYRLRVHAPAGYSPGAGLHPDGRAINTFTVTAGASLTNVDAPLIPPAFADLGDRVWNDADRDGVQDAGESGVSSVQVQLLAADGTRVTTTMTNFQGTYSFENVLPGAYKVSLGTYNIPSSMGFSPRAIGSSQADSDIDPLTGASLTFNLSGGALDLSRDVGIATCFDLPLVPKNAHWLWKTGETPWPSDWKQASPASLAGWAADYSPFGFGDGAGIAFETAIPDPTAQGTSGIFTTYFRHSFHVEAAAMFRQPLQLTFHRNDGVVVYLNGTEVVRRNMPWGAATFPEMPASTNATETETISIPPSLLVSGTNVIAVELHEVKPEAGEDNEEPEGVFDLTLTGKSCDCRLAAVNLQTSDTAYLQEDEADENEGGKVTAGIAGFPTDEEVTVLRWPTTGIPSNAEVVYAEMLLTPDTVSNASGVRFRVWPVLRSWTEGSVTWNTPWVGDGVKDATDRDLSNPVGLMVLRTEDVQGSVPLSSHAWGLIEGWADGLVNHGFVIGDEGPAGEINLHSDEAATVANRPTLRVIYRKPICQ
ncbi:MAG TPA: SdrD B-like domain-containing protein [Thermoanaerobaculia bacterium]|nr:SdrD B-like domain-containing protein [Thermoanaerobaculia bacterium]